MSFETQFREMLDEVIGAYDFGDAFKEAAEEAVNDLDVKDAINDELPDFDELVSEKVDKYFRDDVSLDDMATEAAEKVADEAADRAVASYVASDEFEQLMEAKLRKILKRVVMGLFDPEPANNSGNITLVPVAPLPVAPSPELLQV